MAAGRARGGGERPARAHLDREEAGGQARAADGREGGRRRRSSGASGGVARTAGPPRRRSPMADPVCPSSLFPHGSVWMVVRVVGARQLGGWREERETPNLAWRGLYLEDV